MSYGTGALHPLVAVVGPTGSGKSSLSLRLAAELDGEIVNCDSLQLYRYFNIGTAKIGDEERRGIPHYMIDVLNPDELTSAGDYARRARAAVKDITSRGRLPVVVGGTGFYLRALVEGLFDGPSRSGELRARLAARERRRPGSLHRLLKRFDRDAAGRIHAKDVQKVTRALEVCLLARRPLTKMFGMGRDELRGYRTIKIGLNPPRAELYEILNHRAQQMFHSGLVKEVSGILQMGYSPTDKPFEAIGYREALAVVRGEMTEEAAILQVGQSTRQYAKRQWTWFLRDREIHWIQGFGHAAAAQASALDRVRAELSTRYEK